MNAIMLPILLGLQRSHSMHCRNCDAKKGQSNESYKRDKGRQQYSVDVLIPTVSPLIIPDAIGLSGRITSY
jgi:hypothetical protein